MTLRDYANDRDSILLFYTSTALPGGETIVVGHHDMDFAERRGLLDLNGFVDHVGEWWWMGRGKPTDDRGNSIVSVRAWCDAEHYTNLVRDYEEDC